jgi:hypothetical protein
MNPFTGQKPVSLRFPASDESKLPPQLAGSFVTVGEEGFCKSLLHGIYRDGRLSSCGSSMLLRGIIGGHSIVHLIAFAL